MRTENDIAGLALRFLRHYYKDLKRLGDTQIMLDQRTNSNIPVDGKLFFQKDKNTQFSVTVEASTAQKTYEVVYEIDQLRLYADVAVIGLFFWLILGFWLLEERLFLARDIGWVHYLGAYYGSALAFMTSLYFLLPVLVRRYRLILAIRRFRDYRANEKWIALEKGILGNHTGTQFQELRRQATKNGYGILTVSDDDKVEVILTPQRTDLLPTIKATPIRPSTDSGIIPRLFWDLRHIRWQAFLITVGGVIQLFLFFQQNQLFPINQVGETTFREMKNATKDIVSDAPLDTSYVYDPADTLTIAPVDPNGQLPSENPPKAWLYSAGTGYAVYDCARLFNESALLYAVTFELYEDFGTGVQAAKQLRKYGYPASLISGDCYTGNESGYLLYIGDLFPAKGDARAFREILKNDQSKKRLNRILELRPLTLKDDQTL